MRSADSLHQLGKERPHLEAVLEGQRRRLGAVDDLDADILGGADPRDQLGRHVMGVNVDGHLLPRLLDEPPQHWRRQRQRLRLDLERRQRIGDRIADGGGDGNDAALARALCAERIAWRGAQFQRHAAHIGKVGRGRHQIVGERRVQQLRVLIVDQVVEKDAAEPLHQRADRLAVHDRRVDGAADILDRHIVEHFDMAGAVIDRDMGRMRAVAVGALVVGEGRLDDDRAAGFCCDLAEARAHPWRSSRGRPPTSPHRRRSRSGSRRLRVLPAGASWPLREWPSRPSPRRGSGRCQSPPPPKWSSREGCESGRTAATSHRRRSGRTRSRAPARAPMSPCRWSPCRRAQASCGRSRAGRRRRFRRNGTAAMP